MSAAIQPSRRSTSPTSAPRRLRWVLADAWTITRRDLIHWQKQPAGVISGWFFPVPLVLIFGFLFGGAIRMPQGANYIEFLMPGMFALIMFFGLETTRVAVSTDAAKGVTDRFRSLPMSAVAVVLGRCLADMLNAIVGLGILIVTGLLLGWRWHGTLANALVALGLLLLLRFSLLWVGIFVGLNSKPETVTAIGFLSWPIGFLSNVFVDPSTMPAWLAAIAEWNPLSATAAATRKLFENPGWQGTSWATENAGVLAVVWPVLLIVVFLPLSARKYRRLSR